MSLQHIQLSPIILQELFKHSLVEIKDTLKTKSTAPVETLKTLGNNKKNVLILVSVNEAAFLPDDQLNFLLGILSACKLTMDDVAILNIHNYQSMDYKILEKQLKPLNIILFGVHPGQIELPLDFPFYQVQRFNHQVYLAAPGLLKLQLDKSEKTKLWNSLKQVFSI